MKQKLKKSIFIFSFLLLASFMFSLYLWITARNVDVDYKKIEVIVKKVETIYPKNLKGSIQNKVIVIENGTEKELQNVKKGFSYFEGKKIEAFKYEDILYEDIDGVKSNTKIASYYFISLAVFGIILTLLISMIVAYRRQI